MTNILIILLVLVFTISMLIVGMVFNKVWGVKSRNLIDIRVNFSNLQKRMTNAQLIGDIRQMRQLQVEANQMLKSMMTKQFVPLCARCILFFGVWIILDVFVFFNYRTGLLPFPIPFLGDGWVALYFLFSIGFMLLFYGGKMLYRKVTGKEKKKSIGLRELMNDLSLSSPNITSGEPSLTFDSALSDTSIQNDTHDQNKEDIRSSDRWKDKIQK